jgi:hypothetical protein
MAVAEDAGLVHHATAVASRREGRVNLERHGPGSPRRWGAKLGAIIGRHQATSGRLKRSITEIKQA